MSLRPAHRSLTRVSGSLTGSFRRYRPLTALKSAALAPMPSASDTTTTVVQPLSRSRLRTPCRRSFHTSASVDSLDASAGANVGKSVSSRADPTEPEAEPWATPLAWVERRQHAGLHRILRQHGADR